ncbi:hypothetical protein ACUV84_040179 [Puccinellia chinampoensis]
MLASDRPEEEACGPSWLCVPAHAEAADKGSTTCPCLHGAPSSYKKKLLFLQLGFTDVKLCMDDGKVALMAEYSATH